MYSLPDTLRSDIARTLDDRAEALDIKLVAYCVMPDQVHILAIPHGTVSLIEYVQQSLTTRTYWECGGRGKLWQRGFYDHILRRDEAMQDVARYIIGNPIRAGRVTDSMECRYSSPHRPL